MSELARWNLSRYLVVALLAASILMPLSASIASAADTPKREITTRAGVVDGWINTFETYQTIDGFGGAITWYSDWLTEHPNGQEVFDLLFKDAGLDILRIKNEYKYKSILNEFKSPYTTKLVKSANEAAGKKVQILMSSWSQSADLKSNNSINGGGTLKKGEDGQYEYEEYGQYWYDLLQAYASHGVVPDYISIQNEPDYEAGYDGCEFDPSENSRYAGYDRAFSAVYSAIESLPNPPKMFGPETLTADATTIKLYLDPIVSEDPNQLYGVAHHLYSGGTEQDPDSFIQNMRQIYELYPDMPRWQTEYYRGDAIQTAWLIHNSMVEERANAYLYWDLIWEYPGSMIGMEYPYDQKRWKTERGYMVGDKYYAVKHFSKFVEPGYKRIGASIEPSATDIRMSAYISPDQSRLAIILVNTQYADSTVKLELNGYRVSSSEVYLSNFQDGATDRFAFEGALDDDHLVNLPAQSIATVSIVGMPGERPMMGAATLYCSAVNHTADAGVIDCTDAAHDLKVIKLAPGEYTKDDLFSLGIDVGTLSALEVQYGYMVTLYEGACLTGRSWSFIDDIGDLGATGCTGVSSLSVTDAEIRNVALGAAVDANYSPKGASRAIDGSLISGWSAYGNPPIWLSVDLAKPYVINRWVVKNSEAGPLSTSTDGTSKFNAADYRLQKSDDGQNWVDVDGVTGNTLNITDRPVEQFEARYVRLVVTKPSSIDGANNLKIYEFEVYGAEAGGSGE